MNEFRRRPALALCPLAAALAMTGVAAAPLELPLPHDAARETLVREDGTPIRTALRAWHESALAAFAPAAAGTAATTRVVTNCEDAGPGSLRDVVAAAASGDTVDLTGLVCGTISLETGAIAVQHDSLDIVGPGASSLAIDGNGADRVFLHYGAGSFRVRNLTVRDGAVHATGFHLGIAGCIASAGYLTLDHSVVTGCVASGEGAYGGAVYAYSLILSHSTLSDNLAYGVHPTAGTAAFGGGAFVYQLDLVGSTVSGNRARHHDNPLGSYDIAGGVMTIRGGFVIDSTIDANDTFGRGGGLASFDDLLIRNSTISGNVATTAGGGGVFLRRPADLVMLNSTITSNRAHDGGGLVLTPTEATLQSSIVAGNRADAGFADDVSTQLSGAPSFAIAGGNDLIDGVDPRIAIPEDSVRGDPGLAPLADNGGPTRTHALRPGSAALDGGSNPAALDSDQRGTGYPRVIGAAPDIGAFEGVDATTGAGAPSAVPTLSRRFLMILVAALTAFGIGRAARARLSGR